MSFWSSLISKLKRGLIAEKEGDFISFNVKCSKCGEEIKINVNRRTDLQNLYKESGEPGPAYTLTKEILGKRCPNLIRIQVDFDRNYQILSQNISGGKFITSEKGQAGVKKK